MLASKHKASGGGREPEETKMKLATARIANELRPMALLRDGRYLNIGIAGDLGLLSNRRPGSVAAILDERLGHGVVVARLVDGVESGVAGIVDQLAAAHALRDAVDLAAPVQPALILCTGGSYLAHMKEMGVAPPKAPGAFIKAAYTVTGPRDPIYLPPAAPGMVDFECEFSCVFGRPCHNVTADEALDYVAGYTMLNDVSARDGVGDFFASLAGGNPKASCDMWDGIVRDKQYPSFCPLGPVVATKDELDPHDVTITTLLNGKVMQSANTRDLFFPIGEIIAYFSRWFTFAPGDVISTGSPAGVGYASNPKVFMKAGDIVEVSGSMIGSLVNPVIERP